MTLKPMDVSHSFITCYQSVTLPISSASHSANALNGQVPSASPFTRMQPSAGGLAIPPDGPVLISRPVIAMESEPLQMNGRRTSVSVISDAPRSGNSLFSPDPVGLLYRRGDESAEGRKEEEGGSIGSAPRLANHNYL